MSEEKKEITVDTKKTWLNRIASAVVGALIAVGSMLGITTAQVTEQKTKVVNVQKLASEALDAIKTGDVTVATAKLQEAVSTGKEVVVSAKEIADKVNEADSKSIVETVKNSATEALVKDEVAKTEKVVDDIKKSADKKSSKKSKISDVKAKDEIKKAEQASAVYK